MGRKPVRVFLFFKTLQWFVGGTNWFMIQET